MEAEQSHPVPVSRPDPGPGEAEEGGQDVGAVLLDEGEDGAVGRRIQNEGDEVTGLSGKGLLDSGEERGVSGEEGGAVLQGAGQSRGQGWAGGCEEVLQIALWAGAGGEAAGPSLSRSPVAALPVTPVAPTQHPGLDRGGAVGGGGGAAGPPEWVGAAAEGEEGGAEVAEAGQGGGLGCQLPVPVLAHCCLHRLLPEIFRGGRGGEGDHGVREGIQEADLPDLAEP